MFIIETIPPKEATGELKLLYRKIERVLGFVPPHFELFATLDPKSLSDFIVRNLYFNKHPKIDATILPILRLCIAQKECRSYCVDFNTKLLRSSGVAPEILGDITNNLDKLGLEKSQILILSKVLQAIDTPEDFDAKDLAELYDVGFSDKDFYELLEYGANFAAKSKMIEVYLQ